ncbi:MAG: geranylgeranylglyceryl/heptaprenylglyceryl phosphate synthase [Candidatus Thermoplasmatota archaeon]|nr:geranylgeranylglyceryl/heptaprenylglyceryl phosphate synthase [Euryarchaeota archaeon]MBU4033075.1 geranylgeranylglyceryl/heptaprenylglyceryl phosphate synthase [Candidatus Thermoplasmatota archaeon]MBU4072333.1 geranylgeranylglyceryl/heptaprenylglyceryl phosphate synthase [Candidatus Thermoplasmatota archaeon]MBU4143635.1 geranylgeranylglyceryl/heptaprenylglyceryl phosphate synthase [Candidatus Thermoplasmatota archaeon]MBU4591295.1 geranylgeranylglyceryl/heptaprenylglyceryl phosphate synth
MNVMEIICNKLETQKLHMTLLDPDDQEPSVAARIASEAVAVGTDAIMLGGSTGVTQEILDETVIAIKSSVDIPVILFPTEAKAISLMADAIYFMSLLNSRNPKFLLGEQMKAAALIKKSGLEPISMGYIIVEPGMRAGMVGEAELIRRDDMKTAIGYSVAGELLGMKLIYLEAGSGAPEPVPSALIQGVRKAIDIPLIVGGGIRSPEQASAAIKAGADIIVTGTIVEEEGITEKFRNIVKAIKA